MNSFEMEIWYHLCGFYPELKKKITSPWRSSDRNPGCSFALYKDWIHFYDHSDSIRHGKSCVQMYAIQYNLTFEDALAECKLKFSKKPSTSKTKSKFTKPDYKETEDSNTEYKVIKKAWTANGKKYWKDLGVTNLSDMFEVKRVGITKELSVRVVEKDDELTFCYLYNEGQFKIYTPYSNDPKSKWMGTVKKYNCWWYECGSDILLTLKSSKCYKVVHSIVTEENWQVDLNHLQGENVGKTKAHIPNYTKIKKYKKHVIIFDPDEVGRTSAEVCRKEIGSITPFVDVAKDIADMYLLKGRTFTRDWLYDVIFNSTITKS